MNTFKKNISRVALLFLLFPVLTFAQLTTGDDSGPLADFGKDVINFIGNTLVPLVFAVAFVLFVYGMYMFFIAGGGDDGKRSEGKNYIIWSVIGIVVMVSIWGITNLIAGGLGLNQETLDADLIPNVFTR